MWPALRGLHLWKTTLNGLRMFKKMPLLDKGEIIEFFFALAPVYFKSDKPNAAEHIR
jgi:hypothetical protein